MRGQIDRLLYESRHIIRVSTMNGNIRNPHSNHRQESPQQAGPTLSKQHGCSCLEHPHCLGDRIYISESAPYLLSPIVPEKQHITKKTSSAIRQMIGKKILKKGPKEANETLVEKLSVAMNMLSNVI